VRAANDNHSKTEIMITFDGGSARDLVSKSVSNSKLKSMDSLAARAYEAHASVIGGSGAGSEFLGWRDLLLNPNDALIEDIIATAERIRREADVLICIGIGGSYLGARAVISALTPYFSPNEPGEGNERTTEIVFAGHHMSGAYMRELLQYLEGKSVYLNVISKSGTTLEPALAFRFLRDWMETRFDDADDRIIVTTDPEKGALNKLRETHDYKKYVIPPDVGGRFSVLTPVGLLPIAAAGVDTRGLFYGARSMCESLQSVQPERQHPALEYAATRFALNQAGYGVEALAVFEPRLADIAGWWQQLFGESEGKDHKGLFPVGVQYSTDLHSLGQYMQDGARQLIETFLVVENDDGLLRVENEASNLDGLNYLTGRSYSEINRRAYEGTAEAHAAGDLPNMSLWLDRITPDSIGELIYLFEHAVAVSGYLLGVDPFDQPGVEAYKKAMFRLLGRPAGGGG
jgi:glucose-6-phosphate isomerase